MNYDDNLELLLNEKLSIFKGKTQKYLIDLLYVNSELKNKSSNHLIVKKMLENVLSNEDYERVYNSNYRVKTVRIDLNDKVKESMSFPTIDFIKLSQQTWIESDLYRILKDEVFLFFVFRSNSENTLYFDKVIEWRMPDTDIVKVEEVWQKTKTLVNNGIKIIKTDNQTINNLPKQRDHEIIHIRPHARNANDLTILPDKRKITKQCFWLNSTYIKKIISQSD